MCVCVCVFANGLGELGSILDRVIPKTIKMVLDASLFYTHHYLVRIKGKWSNLGKEVAFPLHLSVAAIEKGAFVWPLTSVCLRLRSDKLTYNLRYKRYVKY